MPERNSLQQDIDATLRKNAENYKQLANFCYDKTSKILESEDRAFWMEKNIEFERAATRCFNQIGK